MTDICDQCERPVTQDAAGNWVHAEVADAVFCDLVMRSPERARQAQAAAVQNAIDEVDIPR